ncbi:PepSY-associated TM helix domain-containing protein [Arenibacter lacus]|uniref:PepSY-associated TM helix domain-containing protein n=1 Tax=Arenibacter lacus TaxID=2608629 RepID=UPI00123C8B39|nr:PepSY-associated TM helix domain-containing protein [Arenibacter lacus]
MNHLNKTIRKIHLWLGISCGLLASFSGLTGALYVWQPEITAALNPRLLTVRQVDSLPEETLMQTASQLIKVHKDSLVRVNLPYREQQTISLLFNNGTTRYYHPKTTSFLGTKSASIHFFEQLLNVHRTLAIPIIGKYIMGGSTIIFLVIILGSGMFIWWKAYKSRLKKGFQIKWKGKKKRLNYDLHKVLGVYFLIPLILIALSGAYFTYPTYYKSVLSLLDGTKKAQNQQIESRYTFTQLFRIPDTTYALRAIYFPKDGTDSYHFRYIQGRFISPGLRKSKELKITEANQVISETSYELAPNSDKIALQFYPIHTGEIAGLAGRILVFISGLVPLILYITGIRMYWFKKKNRTKKSAPNVFSPK